jgi:iron complex transport system substrate-binding protein
MGFKAFPLRSSPQRIISGMPSVTEMLYALDLGDRVVGVTTNCNFPPAAKKKDKIGGFFLNLEKIVSLKPDLIVMVEDAQKKDIQRFRDFGLPVYTINPHNVQEVMGDIIKLGDVTGTGKRARALVNEMKRRIAAAKPKEGGLRFLVRRPKVLVVVGNNPLIVVGGGTFIDDIIRRAGAENLAAGSRAAYPQYSLEKLLKEDPEYIVISKGIALDDPRWKNLTAVKLQRVLKIDADILSRPGPRVAEAIESIADFIYGKKN